MDDRNNNVTAQWARNTAENILNEKINTEINKCLEAVKKGVSENKFTVSLLMYANTLTIKELEKRGFVVKQETNQLDGSYLRISW